VSCSGGKDSTALLLWAIENLQDIKPVFADTGNEHEWTLEYIDYLEQATGIKIERVRNSLTFFELCKKKKIFPSPRIRFCTGELKMKPIRNYLTTLPELTTMLTGERRDESRNRRCKPDWEWSEFYKTDIWRPLADWTVKQVFDIHRRHNIKPNPLYKLGFSRVGCMPCIMERKSTIEIIARLFPEHIDKIRQWEEEMRKVQDKGKKKSTFFARGPIDKVVNWSGANQMELYRPSCESVYGLCE